MNRQYHKLLAHDLAKSWLGSTFEHLFAAPYRRSQQPHALQAHLAFATPVHYNANPRNLFGLKHQAMRALARGKDPKKVYGALKTSSQRLQPIRASVAPSVAPKGFGGGGFSGSAATQLGAAPGMGSVVAPAAPPPTMLAPTSPNPPVQSYPH